MFLGYASGRLKKGRKIGKKLFELGCVHAKEIDAKLAEEEPCDVQMEYKL